MSPRATPDPGGPRRWPAVAAASTLAALAAATPGCDPFPSFPPESLVDSVRILAVRADRPYAMPGDTVKLDVLAVDGRAHKPLPMRVFWVPHPCIGNFLLTLRDCYQDLSGRFPTGVDLDSALPGGDSLSVTVPDIPLTEGHDPARPDYGAMYVFQMACAGHVRYLGSRAGPEPDAIPFACFDEAGERLGSSDFMFSLGRVLLVPGVLNQNPVIDGLDLDSAPVDLQAGITVPHCTAAEDEACKGHTLSAVVPESSQEINLLAGGGGEGGAAGTGSDSGTTGSDSGSGSPSKEAVWVRYYATLGELPASNVLHYTASGKAIYTNTLYRPPRTEGEGELLAIVRDNRGGVNWLRVPLHIQ